MRLGPFQTFAEAAEASVRCGWTADEASLLSQGETDLGLVQVNWVARDGYAIEAFDTRDGDGVLRSVAGAAARRGLEVPVDLSEFELFDWLDHCLRSPQRAAVIAAGREVGAISTFEFEAFVLPDGSRVFIGAGDHDLWEPVFDVETSRWRIAIRVP